MTYPGFHGKSRGVKIVCDICGASGYPGGRWMDTCKRGHARTTCCDRVLSVLKNGKPRTHSIRPKQCTFDPDLCPTCWPNDQAEPQRT